MTEPQDRIYDHEPFPGTEIHEWQPHCDCCPYCGSLTGRQKIYGYGQLPQEQISFVCVHCGKSCIPLDGDQLPEPLK